MKSLKEKVGAILIAIAFIASLTIRSLPACAQTAATGRSASAAAVSDTRLIESGIADNQDLLMLSHQASTRAIDGRIKELAQQMEEDHSTALYELQQLASAGGATVQSGNDHPDPRRRQAADLSDKLSNLSGVDFDSAWVSGVFSLEQGVFDDLSAQKDAITNPQLKTIVTRAIPVIRKHCSQLRIMQKDLARAALQQRRQEALQKKKS